MRSKRVTEADRLTKVAEKMFVLYGKGVRISLNEHGRLAADYVGTYRLTRQEENFLAAQAERILFLLPYWRVKLFHSLMTPDDGDFLRLCNINLDLPEDSELRVSVKLPSFETEKSDR